MAVDRRKFLKIATVAALFGGVGKAALELVLPGQVDAADQFFPRPEAIKGKRWAMVVDTRKFHSWEETVPIIKACHDYHNVPQIPNEKLIKWIWATTYDHAFTFKTHQRLAERLKDTPIMVMCNHCENPACVRVCPTKATFQREDGIVMMDMHRCIGCRFCMAACPYGSRSFNFYDPRKFFPGGKVPNPEYPTRTRGVVEKCDFCAERLAVGKTPICVEAAKDGQLVFGDLADPRSEVRRLLRTNYSIRRKPYLGTRPSVYYLV
jgi:molybdopterin-containing oxidoreductase family iron-sulfur binding subunit